VVGVEGQRDGAPRVIVPESIMLAITVGLTLIGGLVPGLLSALTSTLALWFFSFPPGLSFRAEEPFDIVAVFAAGAVACGLVVLVNSIVGRQRRALEAQTKLSWELLAQGQTIAAMQRALARAPRYAVGDLLAPLKHRCLLVCRGSPRARPVPGAANRGSGSWTFY
jgi:K+-sensing histidine kinase KdpD